MLTRSRTMLAGAVVALMLGTAAYSQQTSSQGAPAQKPGQMNMSMSDMMKQCREHCQTAAKSMDDMTKMMNDAKQSNDPAKMHEAMDKMAKPMADMKQHMNMCMNMMDMMQHMNGMMKKK